MTALLSPVRARLVLADGQANESSSLATKWWFWTAIAVAVGSGVAALRAVGSVATSRSHSTDVPPSYLSQWQRL